jgi:hypothetical protein
LTSIISMFFHTKWLVIDTHIQFGDVALSMDGRQTLAGPPSQQSLHYHRHRCRYCWYYS